MHSTYVSCPGLPPVEGHQLPDGPSLAHVVVCGTTLKESERNKKPEAVACIGVRGEGEVSRVGPTADPGLGVVVHGRDPPWVRQPLSPWILAGTSPRGSLQEPPLPEPLPILQLATLDLLGGGTSMENNAPVRWEGPQDDGQEGVGSACVHPKFLFVRDSAAGAREGGTPEERAGRRA